jgi:hypothetical protein
MMAFGEWGRQPLPTESDAPEGKDPIRGGV